jgi:hypothetical protein
MRGTFFICCAFVAIGYPAAKPIRVMNSRCLIAGLCSRCAQPDRKRFCAVGPSGRMSHMGPFQTSNRVPAKSVDPSTADMRRLHRHVGCSQARTAVTRLSVQCAI